MGVPFNSPGKPQYILHKHSIYCIGTWTLRVILVFHTCRGSLSVHGLPPMNDPSSCYAASVASVTGEPRRLLRNQVGSACSPPLRTSGFCNYQLSWNKVYTVRVLDKMKTFRAALNTRSEANAVFGCLRFCQIPTLEAAFRFCCIPCFCASFCSDQTPGEVRLYTWDPSVKVASAVFVLATPSQSGMLDRMLL